MTAHSKAPSGADLANGLPPVHPGDILREDILPAIKESKTRVADLLGVSRVALDNIVNAKSAVTPEMALKLGKLFGNSPEHWLAMQAQYDLKMKREELADQLAAMPTLTPEAA